MKKIFIVSQWLFIILASASFFFLWDFECNAAKFQNKLRFPPDCNYPAQNGFKIVCNYATGKYAVKITSSDDEYLRTSYFGHIETMYSSISDVATFDDSCEAKGYLKAYMKKNEPRMDDYK